MNEKRIAIYGKGGIGKSTTVANLSAALSNKGLKVMVIGCDPKADTTRTLYGQRLPTIINTIKENKNPSIDDIVFKGYNDILCTESGGPEPGVGCAGRGLEKNMLMMFILYHQVNICHFMLLIIFPEELKN